MPNRALLIGINAYPSAPLNGCVNDAVDMAQLLESRYGFRDGEIRLLVNQRATTEAILDRLDWLLSGLRAGDRVVFHYSGHGAQLPTRNANGEVSEVQEAICPVDFDWTEEHAIRGSDLEKKLKAVPQGVEFVWVCDACFSGGLVRAPGRGRTKCLVPPADIAWRLRTSRSLNLTVKTFEHIVKDVSAAVVSACRADQTAADAIFNNRPNGALTYYFLQELEKRDGNKSLVACVRDLRADLKTNNFDQEPQLCGSAQVMQNAFLGGISLGREALLTTPMAYAGEEESFHYTAAGDSLVSSTVSVFQTVFQALRNAQERAMQSAQQPRLMGVDEAIVAAILSAAPTIIQAARSAQSPQYQQAGGQRPAGAEESLIAALASALPALVQATRGFQEQPAQQFNQVRFQGIDESFLAALIRGLIQINRGAQPQYQTAGGDFNLLTENVLSHRS